MPIRVLYKLLKPNCPNDKFLGTATSRIAHLSAFNDEQVAIQHGSSAADPVVITISCLDREGLICDVARTLFEFGLDVIRADFSTDGPWCLLLFWVLSRTGSTGSIKWTLLNERLNVQCPPPQSSLFGIANLHVSSKKNYYLLQTCSAKRLGLLNELSCILWELELEILKVNALTSPDGRAVIVILVSDSRRESQDNRQPAICEGVKRFLGPSCSHCELIPATMDVFAEAPDLEMLYGIPNKILENTADTVAGSDKGFSVEIDNSLSPNHMLLQITARDRRGLFYDCMRVLNDHNLKIAHGRVKTASKGIVAYDLLISQASGNKLLDIDKQRSLQARLQLDICDPVRVTVVKKGPNTELFVASTVEKSGRTRPRMMHDVTSVLQMLGVSIFKAESEKLCSRERIWEMYRFLLVEAPSSPVEGDWMSYMRERVKIVLSG
ncbi:hypothetical protein L7F22_018645 [Adiantum nelumboides]|nr:hypothetical protein [Adiantum nelumboides]